MRKNIIKNFYLKILSVLKIEEDNGVFYIAGNDKLPPPLEAEEELELLTKR